MGKTAPDHAEAPDLHAMAAERFPLLPRAKPVCRALTVRLPESASGLTWRARARMNRSCGQPRHITWPR